MKFGAKRVFAACSHGVLSGPAMDRLKASPIEELMITNSIPLNGKLARAGANKVKVLSVAPLLAEVDQTGSWQTKISPSASYCSFV